MKQTQIPVLLPLGAALLVLATSCTTAPPPVAPPSAAQQATFKGVLPLLETNCAHCHGAQRLPTMPALTDTKALSALIGEGKFIVPGKPESSRFYQVVTLSDNEAGAMPPTGHAISKRELQSLQKWIASGAPLPAENLAITPRGMAPRSR